MPTVSELRTMYRRTDLVKVAELINGHGSVVLLCDEKRVYAYPIGKVVFSVEWVEFYFTGDTDHKATAEAIERRLKQAN